MPARCRVRLYKCILLARPRTGHLCRGAELRALQINKPQSAIKQLKTDRTKQQNLSWAISCKGHG